MTKDDLEQIQSVVTSAMHAELGGVRGAITRVDGKLSRDLARVESQVASIADTLDLVARRLDKDLTMLATRVEDVEDRIAAGGR